MAHVTVMLHCGAEAIEREHDLVSDVSVGKPPGKKAAGVNVGEMHSAVDDHLNIEMMESDSAHYNMLNVVGWHCEE